MTNKFEQDYHFFAQFTIRSAENFVWAAKICGFETYTVWPLLREITKTDEYGSYTFRIQDGHVAVMRFGPPVDITKVWEIYYLVEGYSIAENGTLRPPGGE